MIEKYQPSNGSEGCSFTEEFCDQCEFGVDNQPCGILFRSMAFDIEDNQYPSEWVYETTTGKAECTVFRRHDPRPKERGRRDYLDKRQLNLFG